MKYCYKCKQEVEGMFCPKCKSMTKPLKEEVEADLDCQPGDTYKCTIWQGPNNTRGIQIGNIMRRECFIKTERSPVFHVDGKKYYADITDGFWNKCAEIRVLRDENGNNFLADWLAKNGLHPPQHSKQLRGSEDIVLVEVINPGKEFKLTIQEGSGRN